MLSVSCSHPFADIDVLRPWFPCLNQVSSLKKSTYDMTRKRHFMDRTFDCGWQCPYCKATGGYSFIMEHMGNCPNRGPPPHGGTSTQKPVESAQAKSIAANPSSSGSSKGTKGTKSTSK